MADQGSEGLLSPFLRKRRFNAATPYLRNRVLDIGCGSGELAKYVVTQRYLGIEIDEYSLKKAKLKFPDHVFISCFPNESEKFDTVVALAVIEHISDPVQFLRDCTRHLSELDDSSIVITTPHPLFEWIHALGASLGFFSKHANEEHEELLDKAKLDTVGRLAGLRMVRYRRFLLGANQLAVYMRGNT
jgi:SAM-dependent methyltransferase